MVIDKVFVMNMSSIVNLVVPHIEEIVKTHNCNTSTFKPGKHNRHAYVSFLMVLFLMPSIGGFAILHYAFMHVHCRFFRMCYRLRF